MDRYLDVPTDGNSRNSSRSTLKNVPGRYTPGLACIMLYINTAQRIVCLSEKTTLGRIHMHLCYLDFDGVLHDSTVWLTPDRGVIMGTPGHRLFEWESTLVDLLAPHPQVQIVLSTAWVRAKSFTYARDRLHPSIGARVIGATFHHGHMDAQEFAMAPRGMQVWGDVHRRQPSDWFAIDDDAFGWPAWCRDKLVQTRGGSGLSDPAIQEEIRRRLAAWQP